MKPKYVHYSKRVHYHKEEFQPYYKHCWKTNIRDLRYLMYVHILSHACNVTSFPCTNCVVQEQVFIFPRLKINHESHEFILDPGTVANMNY